MRSETGQETHQHCGDSIKHVLMMVACCLIPVIGILFLRQQGYEGTGNYLLFLLCPLMHLFMMRGVHNRKNER